MVSFCSRGERTEIMIDGFKCSRVMFLAFCYEKHLHGLPIVPLIIAFINRCLNQLCAYKLHIDSASSYLPMIMRWSIVFVVVVVVVVIVMTVALMFTADTSPNVIYCNHLDSVYVSWLNFSWSGLNVVIG